MNVDVMGSSGEPVQICETRTPQNTCGQLCCPGLGAVFKGCSLFKGAFYRDEPKDPHRMCRSSKVKKLSWQSRSRHQGGWKQSCKKIAKKNPKKTLLHIKKKILKNVFKKCRFCVKREVVMF